MSTLKDVYGESALNFEVTTIKGDMNHEEITLVAPRIHSTTYVNGLTNTSPAYTIGRFPTDYTQYAVKPTKPVDFTIEKVIFNNPATIILWKDGTKTVVKCSENDGYDPEKGLAMAICKKALGNQGNYYNVFTKHLSEYYKTNAIEFDLMDFAEAIRMMFGMENSDG
jgi:hypothetical protein